MIRMATSGECRILAEMAARIWDSHTVDELETEFVETLNDKQSSWQIPVCRCLYQPGIY